MTKMQRCVYESCQRMIQTETETEMETETETETEMETETETDTRCMHMNIHAFVLSCVMFSSGQVHLLYTHYACISTHT